MVALVGGHRDQSLPTFYDASLISPQSGLSIRLNSMKLWTAQAPASAAPGEVMRYRLVASMMQPLECEHMVVLSTHVAICQVSRPVSGSDIPRV